MITMMMMMVFMTPVSRCIADRAETPNGVATIKKEHRNTTINI